MLWHVVYKKHYPPAQKDEVWRLEKIGKDGAFHKKLNKAGIRTVEEFLRLLIKDSQKLRNVSFTSMSCENFSDCCSNVFFYDCRFLEVGCQIRCGIFLWSMPRPVSLVESTIFIIPMKQRLLVLFSTTSMNLLG